MARRMTSVNLPEPYIDALDGLGEYNSRTVAITLAVKRLIQYEVRAGNLKLSKEKRLFYNV